MHVFTGRQQLPSQIGHLRLQRRGRGSGEHDLVRHRVPGCRRLWQRTELRPPQTLEEIYMFTDSESTYGDGEWTMKIRNERVNDFNIDQFVIRLYYK